MAKGVSIQIEGLNEVIKKIGSIPEDLKVLVDAEMGATAATFVDRAVAAAPVDNGILRNGISFTQVGEMDWEIVSSVDYSPFVEFGTRSRVKVPAELSSYAAQFRNVKTGTAQGAKKLIFAWCKRKGIKEEAWEAIYIKIMRSGINPHPFFFPQLPIARAEINKNLKQVVANVLK
jgi:hypothetical protein